MIYLLCSVGYNCLDNKCHCLFDAQMDQWDGFKLTSGSFGCNPVISRYSLGSKRYSKSLDTIRKP